MSRVADSSGDKLCRVFWGVKMTAEKMFTCLWGSGVAEMKRNRWRTMRRRHTGREVGGRRRSRREEGEDINCRLQVIGWLSCRTLLLFHRDAAEAEREPRAAELLHRRRLPSPSRRQAERSRRRREPPELKAGGGGGGAGWGISGSGRSLKHLEEEQRHSCWLRSGLPVSFCWFLLLKLQKSAVWFSTSRFPAATTFNVFLP